MTRHNTTPTRSDYLGIGALLESHTQLRNVPSRRSYGDTPVIPRTSTPRSFLDFEAAPGGEYPYAIDAAPSEEAYYDSRYNADLDWYAPDTEQQEHVYYDGHQSSASATSEYTHSIDSRSSYQPTVFSARSVATTLRTAPPPEQDPRGPGLDAMVMAAPFQAASPTTSSSHPCEFCGAHFAVTAHQQWLLHITTVHLQRSYPRTAGCVFCPATFKSRSSADADRQSNFRQRMKHMQEDHIETSTVEDRAQFLQPDWHLYGHLQRKGILSDADARRLMGDFIPAPRATMAPGPSSRTHDTATYQMADPRIQRHEDRQRRKDEGGSRSRRR